MTEMTDTVVRAWTSQRTHVVTVPLASISEHASFRVTFRGLSGPLIARCGTSIRSRDVVVMPAGAGVHCQYCRRITGVEVQP